MATQKRIVGLRPNSVWKYHAFSERKEEINQAISRYVEAKKDIPWVWIQEHHLLESQLAELVPKQ